MPFLDLTAAAPSDMITFRDISAAIRLDGRDLPHFEETFDKDGKTVTCWIPSVAGKSYSVWFKMTKDVAPGAFISGRIYLDGARREARGSIIGFGETAERYAARVSTTEERPFVFGNIALTGMYNFAHKA